MPSERERIDTGSDKRYVRRDEQGQFTDDQADVGRASQRDQQQQSETPARAARAIGETMSSAPRSPSAVALPRA